MSGLMRALWYLGASWDYAFRMKSSVYLRTYFNILVKENKNHSRPRLSVKANATQKDRYRLHAKTWVY